MEENLGQYISKEDRVNIYNDWGDGKHVVSKSDAQRYPTLNFAIGYTLKLFLNSYDSPEIYRIK